MAKLFSSVFHKKTISLISIFLFSLFFIPFINSLTPISNCAELQTISNNLTEDYYLTNDINCSGYTFIPIGSLDINWTEDAFMGTFDGNNYTISNLYINIKDDDDNIVGGLFGLLGTSGIVTNVGIINANVTFSHYDWGSAGILVGESYGIINNSYTTGTIKGEQLVGGLLGYNWNLVSNSYSNANVIADKGIFSYSSIGGLVGDNDAHIINSYATGNVTGIGTGTYIGGLVGFFYEGTINNSYAIGNINGDVYVGGLVGSNIYGIIDNSFATGKVIGDGIKIGGLVGDNYEGTITNSFATGDVNGDYNVGGLVGSLILGGTITNSYSTGDVTGEGSSGGLVGEGSGTIINSYATGDVSGFAGMGGLVGSLILGGTITNSYSIGNVIGFDYVGGLVGGSSGTVTNSYYNTNTSGQNDTGKGIPKTTLEMKNIFTYEIWDISASEINLNNGYPYLFYQGEETDYLWYIYEPECYINEDCNEGYFCNLEGICELIEEEPTPKSTILTNVGMAMLVVLFSIGIIKFVVGKFKK